MVRRLGAVQLDTISVLARSHELVAYARLGPVGRAAVESAYWGGDAFEYWAHAACVMPIEDWPWTAARRRRMRDARHWHGRQADSTYKNVLAQLATSGQAPATVGRILKSSNGGRHDKLRIDGCTIYRRAVGARHDKSGDAECSPDSGR